MHPVLVFDQRPALSRVCRFLLMKLPIPYCVQMPLILTWHLASYSGSMSLPALAQPRAPSRSMRTPGGRLPRPCGRYPQQEKRAEAPNTHTEA